MNITEREKLASVLKSIKKQGPISWQQVRSIVIGDNLLGWHFEFKSADDLIKEWLEEGKLKEVRMPNGETRLSA